VRQRPKPEPEPRGPRVVIVPPGPTACERPTGEQPTGEQAAGDREAFMREVVKEHGAFIEQTIRRSVDVGPDSRQDLGQLTLLAVLRCYDRKQVPDNMRGYLTGIIHNLAATHQQSRQPWQEPGEDPDQLPAMKSGPVTAVQRAQALAKVKGYMARLSPACAEVVRKVDQEGMTLEEAAAALGVPVGTVASRLKRGRERLCALIAADEEIPPR
jgi:RNA polymerase sigma-70 factor (ECF subfamily)